MQDRVIDLEAIQLQKGAHDSPAEGMCIMEAVAWIRHQEDPDVPFNDAPACVSPILRSFAIAWNDRLDDDRRQELKQYIPLLPGTAGDSGADKKRAWLATDWLVRTYTPRLLRLAGLDAQAATLEQLAELRPDVYPTMEPTLRTIKKEVWAARDEKWRAVRERLRAAWAAEAACKKALEEAKAQGLTTYGAIYSKVYNAVYEALRPIFKEARAPVADELHQSVHDLFARMIAVDERESAGAAS